MSLLGSLSGYTVRRVFLFSQQDFQLRLKTRFTVGLCAGLVQVWWQQLKNGNDAINLISQAEPDLIKAVLLCQSRSVYLRDTYKIDLSDREQRLLHFKYGSAEIAVIDELCQHFTVSSLLELDLSLHHRLLITNKSAFSSYVPDVAVCMAKRADPGLILAIARYDSGETGSRPRGHRFALSIESDGTCRFYDPAIGEIIFDGLPIFSKWFAEYWYLYSRRQRFTPKSLRLPAVQVFELGGSLPPKATAICNALDKRIFLSDVRLEKWV